MAALEHENDEHLRAEEAARRILSNGSFSERLGGALLVLLGITEYPSTKKAKPERERDNLRKGLSELFNGWH